MTQLTTALLWFSAIGCGLLAGLYFAFSAFIMTALGRIDPAHGIAAMNAINTVILRSLFMPFFLGTTVASFLLAILGMVRPDDPGAIAMTTGGVVYVAGMFLCTMLCNVPLNNLLASPAAASTWPRYLREWTRWNHVRTIASTAASALFVAALTAR